MKKKDIKLRGVLIEYRKRLSQYSKELDFYQKFVNLLDDIIYNTSKNFKEDVNFGELDKKLMSVLHFYMVLQIHLFQCHIESIKKGLPISPYGILRSVYENIIRSYLVLTCKDIQGLVIDKETKDETNSSPSELEDLNEELRIRGYFGHSYSIKRLYDKDGQISLTRFYHEICLKVHPSIKGLAAAYEVKPNNIKDNIFLSLSLAYPSLLLLYELYGNHINKRYKKRIISVMQEYINMMEGYSCFIPNRKKKVKNLRFKSEQEVVDFIQK